MMNKSKPILNILTKLNHLINSNIIKIKDYWVDDLSAIGLKKGNKLLYISSHNTINDKSPSFYYELEILNEIEEDKYEVLERGENIKEKEMINKIQNLLEV